MKLVSFIAVILLLSCGGNSESPENGVNLEVSSDQIEPDKPAEVPATAVIKPGQYVEYHSSGGIKMKGVYSETLEREGLWIAYYEDGTKWSESYYTQGQLDGHSITFYPNGNVRYIGEYKLGEKTGEWTFYDENGNLTKEEKY